MEDNKVRDNNSDVKRRKQLNEISQNDQENINIHEEHNITSINKKQNEFNFKFFNNNKKILIIVSLVVTSLVILFSSIFLINKLNSNVYKGIKFDGINMSSMNREKVIKTLEVYNKNIKNVNLELVQGGEKILDIKSEDLSFGIDINDTTKKIMGYGRNKGVIKNNIDILTAMFKNNIQIKPTYLFDDEKLKDLIVNIDISLKNSYIDDSYSVDTKTNKLIVKIGRKGNRVNKEKLKDNIIEQFSLKKDSKIEVVTEEVEPKRLDLEDVYKSVNKETKDAYIEEKDGNKTYIKEESGITFDKAKLEEILSNRDSLEEGKEILLDLVITKPKVKITDLTYNLYKDKITSVTTYFNPTLKNRSKNLEVGTSILDGAIIMPGETYSFNKNIGEVASARGFLPAATFKGGKTVDEIGGGICQLSSMLYNAALKSNLQIVSRYQHGLPVGYVEPSLDATVYSPNLDFKFKNTREYPIKIQVTYSAAGTINVSFYGTKEETEYDIELVSKYLYEVPFKTNYTYDSNMLKGEEKVLNQGINGYVSEAYIIKYKDGKKEYEARLSKDTYSAQNKNVVIGTKEIKSDVNIYN